MTPIRQTTTIFSTSHLLDHNYFTSKKTQYTSTYTKVKTHEHNQPYLARFVKTEVPIRTCYTSFDIQTKEKRKALLAIHHKKLTRKEKYEYAKAFAGDLSKTQIKDLVKRDRTRSDYYTHRIIYLRTAKTKPKTTSNKEIWESIFISQKDTSTPSVEQSKHYKDMISYKTKLCELLSPDFLSLFKKIETFSITIQEYSALRKHVKLITSDLDRYVDGLFFPGIGTINTKIKGKRMSTVPKAYLLAATAHFKIERATRQSHVLTEEQSTLTDKMRYDCFSSLKELEYAASILQPSMSPSSFLRLIYKSVSTMEKEGVLPLPQEDINDPYIIEQTEARYALQQKKFITLEDQSIEKDLLQTKPKTPKKRKYPQPPTRSKKHKISNKTHREPIRSTTTQSAWTDSEPSTSDMPIEALERSAIFSLMSLQSY